MTTLLLAVIAASLLGNIALWLLLAAKTRRIIGLTNMNKMQRKELDNVKHRRAIAHDAYRLDADELDKRLQQDFRD